MFRFDKEQVVFDFAGVKMGGQPGEYPTVLAGTIFYGGHNIISDELTGDFDKEKAETLVNDMASISDVTGNPYIVQVFGQTEEAIVKYIEYIGEVCDACDFCLFNYFFNCSINLFIFQLGFVCSCRCRIIYYIGVFYIC